MATRRRVDMLPVFYKGAAAPMLEVLARQITMSIETISPVLPHVTSGRLKALGVTSAAK